MKVECIKDKLQRAIFLTERMVGRNLSLPILSNILIEAKNGKLIIRSTNLDIGIEVSVPAVIEKEGSLTVKPAVLGSFLNNLKGEDKIKLESVNNNITITTKASSTVIKCESAEDFPVIPVVKDVEPLVINGEDFVSGLKSVFFAGATSDIKPEISSVYIYSDGDYLYFVATDSFRLAEKRVTLAGNKGIESMIVPFRNVSEIIRVLDNYSKDVQILNDGNQVSIYTDDFFLTSRIIDGVYPDYRQIMPKKIKTKVSLDREEVVQAFKLTNVFLNKLNQTTLTVQNDNNCVEIQSHNQDVGENTISIPAKIEGEDLTANFNARYITDVFGSIYDSQINFNFDEVKNRLLIQGDKDDFSYLVMPLNR